MLLPSPKRYSQSFRAKKLTEYARDTMDAILVKMTQARYLSEEQRVAETGAALSFERSGSTPAAAPAGASDGEQNAIPANSAL